MLYIRIIVHSKYRDGVNKHSCEHHKQSALKDQTLPLDSHYRKYVHSQLNLHDSFIDNRVLFSSMHLTLRVCETVLTPLYFLITSKSLISHTLMFALCISSHVLVWK